MANARQQKLPKALIRRTLESARREIEQIERKFHRTIKAVQNGGFSTGRRSTKAATARTRSAAGRSMGRPAPVQTAVTRWGGGNDMTLIFPGRRSMRNLRSLRQRWPASSGMLRGFEQANVYRKVALIVAAKKGAVWPPLVVVIELD